MGLIIPNCRPLYKVLLEKAKIFAYNLVIGVKMKIITKFLKGVLIVFIVLAAGMAIWGYTGGLPMPEAIQAMNSDGLVTVSSGEWLVFTPSTEKINTGFIFYPGGRVDYRAYAPYARAIAEQGYLVVVPRMPLNFAVFGINQAEKVINNYPEIIHWVIGGHSLGGSMAANYLDNHQEQLAGLILVASYPAESDNLSDYTGSVASISASLDGLATPDKIQASTPLLPPSTLWAEIEGGNHAQFGWYGAQSGDNDALIPREDQQAIVIQKTLDFLSSFAE